MIRVLALVPYPLGRAPGQRYRLEQWAPHLEAFGLRVEFSSFFSGEAMDRLYHPGELGAKVRAMLAGTLRRTKDALGVRHSNLVYVYREAIPLAPPWIETWVSRRVPVVFDFDDAIYLPAASVANAWARHVRPSGKAAAICRAAWHVTVGNDVLAQFARGHSPSVTVIPSTIDTDRYIVRERPPNPRPVVGWTGSPTTLCYLESLAPALARLRERVDYQLKVVGGTLSLPGLDVHPVPWRADSEVEDLRDIDVGLMPLPDDEWARGKCAMKALQYMALAIPPVVSPVGANRLVVRDGENGFHARDETEWIDRIGLLLSRPDLRSRFGTEGRRTVEAAFSARVQAPRMAQVLRDAAKRAGSAAPQARACQEQR